MVLKNKITLTRHQKEVFEKLDDWFSSSGDDMQSLIGYAGVGKTTMVSQLILRLIKNGKKVCILTFTNKALAVCREVYERYCGKDRNLTYSTIHSFFGLKPDFEITDDEISLLFGAESEALLSADLVIVDEASQLPKSLTTLITRNKIAKTKILFMGDSHQLPPIEKDSKSYKDEEDEGDINTVRTSEAFKHNPLYLTEIIRQKDSNPILNWYTEVHSDLNYLTKTNSLQMLRAVLNGSWEMNKDDQGVFVVKSFDEFTKMFMDEAMNDVAMATFRRDTASRWNRLIHDKLFTSDKQFCVGEPILVYKRWQGETTFNNGEVATITSSYEDVMKVGYYSFDVIKVNTNYGNNFIILKDTELNYACLTEYISQQMGSFDSYTSKNRRIKLGMLYKLFDRIGLVRELTINLGYRKLTLNKTVDYGYSCTTHKLQGTTINNVYICLQDFTSCKNINMLIRLLYVAFSRAKSKVIIFDK